MSCEYAHDDGAYVLGALSPAERAAYERHLVGCAGCRAAVAGLAVLPGLLGRLDAAAAEEIPVRPGVAPSRLAAVLTATAAARRRERRRNHRRMTGAVLAAACAALVLGAGLGSLHAGGPGSSRDGVPGETPPAVAMAAMRPVSAARQVTAEVGLVGTAVGTEVTLRCTYAATGDGYADAWTLRLVAYGPDGATEQVGSWVAAPGDEVTFTGITRFVGPDLVRLRLVKGDGAALLDYEVP